MHRLQYVHMISKLLQLMIGKTVIFNLIYYTCFFFNDVCSSEL